jgi:hypothetical protein
MTVQIEKDSNGQWIAWVVDAADRKVKAFTGPSWSAVRGRAAGWLAVTGGRSR